MAAPVEIAWHNLESMSRVEERVEQRTARLQQILSRITHISVVIEASHRRHQKGNRYEVRLDVGVPGNNLAVNRKPGDDDAHVDILVAVRDAFDAMERQLKRWNQQHSGRPAVQTTPLQGKIAQLDPDTTSGQIATTDGRLVYFHGNAIVSGDFDKLTVSDPVELVVDPGDDAMGAHASTVRPISLAAFIDRPS